MCNILGKGSSEKSRLLSGIARKWGGGFTDARIFWPFFYQVKVPEIGTFLLKSHNHSCLAENYKIQAVQWEIAFNTFLV